MNDQQSRAGKTDFSTTNWDVAGTFEFAFVAFFCCMGFFLVGALAYAAICPSPPSIGVDRKSEQMQRAMNQGLEKAREAEKVRQKELDRRQMEQEQKRKAEEFGRLRQVPLNPRTINLPNKPIGHGSQNSFEEE